MGILKRLAKVLPKDKFHNVSQGIFTSKLTYCLQLFGNVWGIPSLDEHRRRFSAFTKDDNRRLQSLQNKLFRVQTGLPQDTPLTVLLEKANAMSVMQLAAFTTLSTVQRVVSSGQPGYLAERLQVRSQAEGIFPPRHANTIAIPDVELTLSTLTYLLT